MPAFRSPRARRRDSAEVGVGTLIVFIAMVLVAAVAAAVIIGTSGSLQQRAVSTGKEATQEVSSNIQVVGMYGQRNTTSDDIWNVRIYLTLSAGSLPVDLNQSILRYNDGSMLRTYKHDDNASYAFHLNWIRGTGHGNVAQSGDLIELNFTMIDREIAPRADFALQLLQSTGAPVSLAVRTPPTYATDLYVQIK